MRRWSLIMTSTDIREPAGISAWLAGFAIYRNPKVLAMLLLGFSAGLPFMLTAGTLSLWAARSGVSMTTVGFISLVGTVYALKFVWAPLIDQVSVPLLTRVLGRRRSWMLLAQIGIAAALAGMAQLDPSQEILVLAGLAVAVAFFSATQDIALDAWRIEIVEIEMQGAMAASYQLGYRIGLLMAGAGALLIADSVSWPLAYQAMAVLMGVGMLTVMFISEPDASAIAAGATRISLLNEPGRWLSEAVVEPVAEFLRRNGKNALLILLFIGIYRISDNVLGVMANPFYAQVGFSDLEIATYAKTVGFAATMIGAALGGVAVVRHGLGAPLVFGAVILALTNLSFAGLALAGDSIPALVIAICADNGAAGFTGTVFIAYLSGLTNSAYTATQYALFTSLMVLPGKLLSGLSGWVVDQIGWFSFFVYAAVMGIPAILLAVWASRRLD
jgi:PAT family beta-lactamase induction signal transducer AmpG